MALHDKPQTDSRLQSGRLWKTRDEMGLVVREEIEFASGNNVAKVTGWIRSSEMTRVVFLINSHLRGKKTLNGFIVSSSA